MKIFELMPRYDSRKSFYGKAIVIDEGDGVLKLYSYNTLVSICINGIVQDFGKFSVTTSRHQKEFRKQFEA